jgi:cation transport ATPase
LGVKPAVDREVMVRGMRLVAFVGILAVPLVQVILTRLLSIVDSVRAGDPFIIENARRLKTIAATLLGMQLLHVVIGIIAARTRSEVQQLDINWSFSITPWIAVLLLFVLARVFEHGARMRADLEGTV